MYERGEKMGSAIKNIRDIVLKPVTRMTEGVDIEIIGDRDIFVDGCTGIDEFTDERIVFAGNRVRVIVEGFDFEIFTFADGRIKASGKICKIELEREA